MPGPSDPDLYWRTQMSLKTEVDIEAKKLIEQGVPPMEALKQAVQIVTEKLSSEMEESEGESGMMKRPK
jgi:hypothetical protein